MKRLVTSLALVGLLAATGCSKSPQAIVEFNHTIQPKQPLSQDYMNIAVYDARMEGDTGEYDQKKWSEMTADLIHHHLQRASEQHSIPIKLVDRQNIKLALAEKDLAAADITDSGDDIASAQLQGASAILTSKVNIKIDKQKGKSRTISNLGAFAGRWGGGGSIGTSEVEKESRNITVQCQFQLKDAATNAIVVGHTGDFAQRHDKPKTSPFFGSSKTEADMTPRDKVIGDIVEDQLNAFLCKFVPIEVESVCTVKASGHEMSAEGVYALRDQAYEKALNYFKQAIAEDRDDHKSLFGAGVCCEKLERHSDASNYYRQARDVKPKEEQYQAALKRISMVS